MASWSDKDAPSNYGRDTLEEMNKHKLKYNCAGPELFHVRGQRGTSLFPMRMAWKHRHTFLSESFSVSALAKKIYQKDSTSNLFYQMSEVDLDALTKSDPGERVTITHVVYVLKLPLYNMANLTI